MSDAVSWVSWQLSNEKREMDLELPEQQGVAPGLHGNISFHVTAHVTGGRWKPCLREPAAWLRGTMDQQRLTLAFECNSGAKEEVVDERCPLLSWDLSEGPSDTCLHLAVLWIVRLQDIHQAEVGRFIFGQTVGHGQSSEVVEVTDATTGRQDLVAKISTGKPHQLLQEAMILKALQLRGSGFPDFIGLFSDMTRLDMHFMVLQRLRGSLEDLWQMAGISVQSVGIQVLQQLQVMHLVNLAHGDLKAKNMAVASTKPLKITLIDFGCCRPFRVSGHWVHPRSPAAVGTTRFCAIPAHQGERSPRCDLESLAYVLIYLAAGSLPWQGLRKAQSTREHSLQMLGVKQDFSRLEGHVRGNISDVPLADALMQMVLITRKLGLEEEAPYAELQQLLQCSLRQPCR